MRSVLITGASTGIGKATALRLDKAGWRVFAGVRRAKDAEALRKEASSRLTPLRLELTDPDQLRAASEEVREQTEGKLEGLINNAGIILSGPLETTPIETIRHQLEVNLISQIAVSQAFLPQIRKAKGRIAFTSSSGARMALPFSAPYHASKCGLEGVAECLRRELSPWGIKVSIIEPGPIATLIWERGQRLSSEAAERAPQAQEELYGEALKRFWEMGEKLEARAISPERAAKAIEHALCSPRPRKRYVIGLPAKGTALACSLVPDRLLNRAIDVGAGRALRQGVGPGG